MKFKVPLLAFALHFGLSGADNRHTNRAPLRREKECPDGFGGINCKEDIDECQASPYPCAGGIKKGSFCVDYDPPRKFKCGCRPGYEAVLPNASDVKDNVPVEWRPLKCRPRDVCSAFVCHEDATCTVSSNNTAVCICNDNLIGDGITNCSLPPKVVVTKPVSLQSSPCTTNSDCDKLENSVCVEGSCKCKAGFYQSSGKGRCINENECVDGYPNDCHKNAICTDTEGSYMCTCKDGFHDLHPNDKPGIVCAQINECVDPSMNDCNTETQVCLDQPPPLKWQCVERTPAPTPAPTRLPTRAPKICPTLTPLNQNSLCLAGGFPDIKQCIACTFLDLSPFSACQAATVTTTSTGGCIPSEIGLLTWLLSLDLESNAVTGTIPTEIGLMTLLEKLVLRNNQLTGTLPTQIGLMTALTYITLSNNQVGGRIPTFMGKLTNLEYLSLRDNILTGTIPTEIGLMTSLDEILHLYRNQLAGTIPSEIGKLTSVLELSLRENQLIGTIPTEVGLMNSLELIYLYNNLLSGTIPSEIGMLTDLEYMDFHQNRLKGKVPTEIGMTSAIWIYLDENQLVGKIPTEIGLLVTTLRRLSIQNNQLTGSIPTEIGLLTELSVLALGDNKLADTIASEIGLLESLRILSLYSNQLIGAIPTEIGTLTKLSFFNLGGNKLTGAIPADIGSMTALTSLYLSMNRLNGAIPSEIGMLTNIVVLDLSENFLTGPIPPDIAGINANIQLGYLSLYNNDLTGAIPGALDVPTIAVVIDCSEISCVNCLDKDFNVCT